MIKLIDILKELKIEYRDKPYSNGSYTPIETKIKYDNSDIDGVRIKLLTGEASYVNNLTVVYLYVSEPESYENRMAFYENETDLTKLYNKLIDIFSKKEYSYSEVKNILETVKESVKSQGEQEEQEGVIIDDLLDKIPSNLLSNKVKKFMEDNFDDLSDLFGDLFDPEELIIKSPKDLADYFNFVYDVIDDENGENELNIVDMHEYISKYYNSYLK
jgi:hypothetical protein